MNNFCITVSEIQSVMDRWILWIMYVDMWVVLLAITFPFSCVHICHGRLVSTSLVHWVLCGCSYGYRSIMMVQPQHRMRFLYLYRRLVTLVLISVYIFEKFQTNWQMMEHSQLKNMLWSVRLSWNSEGFVFHEVCMQYLYFVKSVLLCVFHKINSVCHLFSHFICYCMFTFYEVCCEVLTFHVTDCVVIYSGVLTFWKVLWRKVTECRYCMSEQRLTQPRSINV